MISGKRIYSAIVLMFFVFISNAQTVHYTEDFNAPPCPSACPPGAYGWAVTPTGLNGGFENDWFISCAENGNPAGSCGTVCAGDNSLHIGCTFPLTDLGATYFAGGLGDCTTNKRAESPVIDLTCAVNPVTLEFNYMENGDLLNDNFTLEYFDGVTWTQIDDPIKTPMTCAPQGQWTAYVINLPASAAGNANVQIGFTWTNDNDAFGTDPSVAIDMVRITSAAIAPVADFTISNSAPCQFDCIDFTDASTPAAGLIYSWDFGGGSFPNTSNAQSPAGICFDNIGTFDVTLTVTDACGLSSSVTYQVTVSNCTGLNANFTASSQVICAGDCIDFTDLSTPVGTIISWNWSFVGAATPTSSAQNPTGICYNTPGVYDVKLSVDDGITQSVLVLAAYITVNNCTPPVANFNTANTNFCSGTCISFNDLSTGNIIGWSWNFPGGTPATSNVQSPTNICYNTPGIYNVSLTVDDGTTTNTLSIPAYINVNNCNPVAAFSASATNICSGSCITFTDNSTNATTWGWGFPGGTPNFFIGQNPTQICYATAGTYDVAQYVADANGNTDTLLQTGYITVTNCGGPTAAFNVNATVGCRNDCFTFTDASTNATSWTWSFPGGSPSSFIGQTPPPICYNNLGIYGVTLIVSDGTFSDTLTQPGYMTINYCGGLLAMFIASDTDICDGDCISFINQSQGNPQGYLWIIPGAQPDTSTSANPPYVCFPNAGDYDVTLIAFDSTGADTVTYTTYIHVNPGTLVTTNIDSTTIFAGQSFQLSASGGVSYKWYPNGSLNNDSIPDPLASPTDTTLYVVVMTDANGCTSSETILINVLPPETIWAPTAFTPNKDNSNDVFNLVSSGIVNNFTMKIYDRWGNMMFQTHDRFEGWDGTYFNKPLNTGVYVYYYRLEYIDGFILEGSGDVTLIR